MSNPSAYVHLKPGSSLPPMVAQPFRAIVVVDAEVSWGWQEALSKWLVHSGCLFMMAWGFNCSSWDDSVDYANMEMFEYGDIPEDKFVMTTWHEREALDQVFWFSKNCAFHPTVKLERTVIFHISDGERESELATAYRDA